MTNPWSKRIFVLYGLVMVYILVCTTMAFRCASIHDKNGNIKWGRIQTQQLP